MLYICARLGKYKNRDFYVKEIIQLGTIVEREPLGLACSVRYSTLRGELVSATS